MLENPNPFGLPACMDRRDAMAVLLAGAAGLAMPVSAAPAVYQDFWYQPRELLIYRAETGEAGRYEYWRNGQLQLDAWYGLLRLFRDVRADVAMHYDPRVVDIVWAIQKWVQLDTGKLHAMRLTDGARLESTNRMIPGASPESEHLKGRALDGRLEGLELRSFAKAARFFRMGGVGLYGTHVHVDCGRIRTWGM